MEDQQPAAGDLTVAADDDTRTADDTVATAAPDTSAEAEAEADAETEQTPDTAEDAQAGSAEPAAPEKAAKKKRPGRWVAAVVALLAAAFVGSAAFAGATVQPYLAERATVDIKLKVARAAVNTVTTLWSYTPENMDSLSDRASNYLTGDFQAQYRKMIDQISAPSKQTKITNSTEVTGVAVESLNGPNATVIVYTNTSTTSPKTKNIPTLQYLAYLLTMKLVDDHWKVTRMNTVTSLDVKPNL